MVLIKKVVALIVLAGLIYGGYYFYQNSSTLIEQMAPALTGAENIDASSEVLQFYPNMRFKSSELTYNIATDCDSTKKMRILRAFRIISEETDVLSFSPTSTPYSDILVSCSKNAYQKGERVFMSGEGGPTKILELSPYPLILQGRVILYNEDTCDYPITELHELFHVFGFEHISDSKVIMYPYLNCKQVLNPVLINKLKEIYSVEALADIKFSKVSVVKAGKYVNLEFQAKNEGLITAESVQFEVYAANGEKIYEDNLGDMNSGAGQEFKLANLEIPSANDKEITLVIKTNSKEYDKENNLIKVQI